MNVHGKVWMYDADVLNREYGVGQYGTGHHTVDGVEHEIKNYSKTLEREERKYEIILRWGFCVECNCLYHKTVYGFDNDENMCFVRELVKAKKPIVENLQGGINVSQLRAL